VELASAIASVEALRVRHGLTWVARRDSHRGQHRHTISRSRRGYPPWAIGRPGAVYHRTAAESGQGTADLSWSEAARHTTQHAITTKCGAVQKHECSVAGLDATALFMWIGPFCPPIRPTVPPDLAMQRDDALPAASRLATEREGTMTTRLAA
jgi:hypothetical protein